MNLSFRVLSKRPDGYHRICSFFQAIDLCDRLCFIPSVEDRLECTHPQVPSDAGNLIWKAVALLREHWEIPPLSIFLDKQIPVQSGLGGGSSNAATTLWALNQQCNLGLSLESLERLGAQLGSDVPFFFSQGMAHVTGRGEQIRTAFVPFAIQGWIAKPSYGLSTGKVYAEHAQTQKSSSMDCWWINDLQAAALRLESRMVDLYARLVQQGHWQVFMTGSGSAWVCLGHQRPQPIENVEFFPFRPIERREDLWYVPRVFRGFAS